MQNISRLFTFSLLIFSLAACDNVTYRKSADFTQEALTNRAVAIVPTEVSVVKMDFTGEAETLTEKEDLAKDNMLAAAKYALKSKGYKISKIDSRSALKANDQIRYATAQLREEVDKKIEKLYDMSMEKEEAARIDLSVDVKYANMVAEATGSDFLLFSKYTHKDKTDGAIARDETANILLTVLVAAAVGGTPSSYQPDQELRGFSYAVLVNGTNGKIFWADRQPYISAYVRESAYDPRISNLYENLPSLNGMEEPKKKEPRIFDIFNTDDQTPENHQGKS